MLQQSGDVFLVKLGMVLVGFLWLGLSISQINLRLFVVWLPKVTSIMMASFGVQLATPLMEKLQEKLREVYVIMVMVEKSVKRKISLKYETNT